MTATMRLALRTLLCMMASLTAARAQTTTVSGQVVSREDGQPLAYTTISLLSLGTQRLASQSGNFTLIGVPAGEARLRFRRIGFAPKDTALILLSSDTARLRIEMTRLAIQLPPIAVTGKCTDRTPFEEKPAILAQLFDQVKLNAEQARLLAKEKPFVLHTVRVRGYRERDDRVVATYMDTVVRPPVPSDAYVPRKVFGRGEGVDAGKWVVRLPELPDLADTAFTNNHCMWYAGQERFDEDSVIRVDYEPVPWLDKDTDIEGSIYLRSEGYQLVGIVMKLNRIPVRFPTVREYAVRARFSEFVSGVPVLTEWELTNTYQRRSVAPRIERGQVTRLTWLTP